MKNVFLKIADNSKASLLIILVVATFLSLWKKGQHDLQEWDESRNGVNAYEMLQNGDYVNFYYNGKLDTWNAKPPLMIWLITLSYKCFGFNEFALRFPSTVCTILFFVLCFFLIRSVDTNASAFLTCLILLSCKAILGNHTGLTGDFDMLLITLLTASVYTFMLYIEKEKRYALYLMMVLLSLAFYTKGPASFVFLPGFVLYAFIRKKTGVVLKDKHLWISLILYTAIVSSWFLLVCVFGKTERSSVYGSTNSIETMLIHDTFRRLTQSNFDHFNNETPTLFFFFQVLDARLNLWNYLFYLCMVIGLIAYFKNNTKVKHIFSSGANNPVLLSFCLILPLSLVLNFSANQHNWYFAPTFMFIAFLTAKGIILISEKWNVVFGITACLIVFTLSRQFYYIGTQSTSVHDLMQDNKNLKDQSLTIASPLRQDMLLYLKWLNVKMDRVEGLDKIRHRNELILISKKQLAESPYQGDFQIVQELDGFILGRLAH